MRSKDLFKTISKSLQTIYEVQEADSIAFGLLDDLYGLPKMDILLDKPLLDTQNMAEPNLVLALQRLLQHEPLQYVTSKAYFFGFEFFVNANTLIPRPETEELVQLIINDRAENQAISSQTILDIGTGTGCIPITLFLHLPKTTIYAVDIDEKTLQVAQKNASALGATVYFEQVDILIQNLDKLPNFDIMVSNPPYVTEREKAEIRRNVLDYEPHKALFVPDENPLLFYRRIAELAQHKLNANGILYFEINQYLGAAMQDLLEGLQFANVQLLKDLSGNMRFCKAFWRGFA
jgi:release factor glutamine methyltransferase